MRPCSGAGVRTGRSRRSTSTRRRSHGSPRQVGGRRPVPLRRAPAVERHGRSPRQTARWRGCRRTVPGHRGPRGRRRRARRRPGRPHPPARRPRRGQLLPVLRPLQDVRHRALQPLRPRCGDVRARSDHRRDQPASPQRRGPQHHGQARHLRRAQRRPRGVPGEGRHRPSAGRRGPRVVRGDHRMGLGGLPRRGQAGRDRRRGRHRRRRHQRRPGRAHGRGAEHRRRRPGRVQAEGRPRLRRHAHRWIHGGSPAPGHRPDDEARWPTP